MRWLKRDMWKAGIALVGMLLLLVFMVWVPVSAAGAYEGASGLATPVTGTVQATPTADATMTALQKQQLTLQNTQLQNQYNWPNWFFNNITAVIAGVVALGGIISWVFNRWDERRKEVKAQDKELRDRAEERFKTAVTVLGDEKEGTQVGGAILLRSFLSKDDEKIYGRYYTQIFDLAVAYLRLPSTSYPSEDSDGIPHSSGLPHSLTPLRQTLLVVFKEVFPLARDRLRKQDPKTQFHPQILDATGIKLGGAFLAYTDLVQAWLHEASLHKAYLRETHLCKAHLEEANLEEANLEGAVLEDAILYGTHLEGAYLNDANLSGAHLEGAYLEGAYLNDANLSGAHLEGAYLEDAILYGVHLEGANPEDAGSLKDTKMNGVTGLTSEQREKCREKGAIFDDTEQAPASATNSPASPPPSQSNAAQAPSVPPAQVNTPPADADGSGPTSSKPDSES